MQAISLMYHDVIESRTHAASGFPWPDAALYKLEPEQFDRHLWAIAQTAPAKPVTVEQIPVNQESGDEQRPLMITFDDGGLSAYTYIADRLEGLGWRGHFFITAGQIGNRAFVTPAQIRELRQRGHVIGSHSHSHPLRMAQCSWDELLWEWQSSVDRLSEILGERVSVASIPGGQYARKIAQAASEAGIDQLFTSEPTARSRVVDRCRVYGRYTIQRWMPPQVAAAMAAGKLAPRLRQFVLWNAKKATKAVGGEYYLKLRRALIG